VVVIADEALGRYGFPNGHAFGPDRLGVFLQEFRARGFDTRCITRRSRIADDEELLRFHTAAHLELVRKRSAEGTGTLDEGDTPAFRDCYPIAARVVGATLEAAAAVLQGPARRGFVPIGGLHHATRDKAAGFCVFNDIGVLIETLRLQGLKRVAYVDIDAHHGDGVFHAYGADPFVAIADVHEDGRFLYPGTGKVEETGSGDARGFTLNVPLEPGADDAAFAAAWPKVLAHVEGAAPEFIILQCGADSLAGDPLAHLQLSVASHRLAAASLAALAERLGHGRLLALGGGGYDRGNVARGWNAVLESLLEA
jgi:acetoin utilization protein AcuC